MIFIENVKKSLNRLSKKYNNSSIIDTSSMSKEPYIKLSPFYPHGNIPVPFSDGVYSKTVEGIWQGLKVFETHDIDIQKFNVDTMSGIKRTTRFFGTPIGHRKGVNGDILDYVSARKLIYLPAYEWVIKHKLSNILLELFDIAQNKDLVLLDYTTNEDLEDISSPLSHASLIKKALLNMDKTIENKTFSNLSDDPNWGQTSLNFE